MNQPCDDRRPSAIGEPGALSIEPSASAARASLSVIGWPPTSASVRSSSSWLRAGRRWDPEPSDQQAAERISSIAHQNACPSEMCSTFDRSRPPVSSRRVLSFQPQSTRSGPIGDRYRNPMPLVTRISSRRMSLGVLEHVAGVEEPHELQVLPVRRARLEIEDRHAVAALREALRIERLLGAEAIEREAAHGGVAAGEEALARRQILDRPSETPPAPARDRPRASMPAPRPRQSRAAAECPAKTRPPGRARAPAAITTPRPGRRRYTKPCANVLTKPTSDPRTRAATEPSTPITAPRCGSRTSSRESRRMPPKIFDSLTCGKRRSISS